MIEVPLLHWFHRWSKWGKAVRVEYSRQPLLASNGTITISSGAWNDDGLTHWNRDEQRRTCTVCGAEQVRIV
jgi:hypothetical protein